MPGTVARCFSAVKRPVLKHARNCPSRGLFGRVEKLRRNAFLLDPALAQEEGAGGDVPRERHLVGDNDHRTSFRRQALHHGQHFAHEFRVERGRRLVEEDYARMNRERPRNCGALLLAARKLAGIGIGAMAEADFRQKRHRFFHSLGAGPP